MPRHGNRRSAITWAMPLGTLLQFVLPRWLTIRIASILGGLAFRFNRRQRLAIQTNMRRVLGPGASEAEVERTALAIFKNLARNYADVLRIPVFKRRVTQLVSFDRRALDAALALNRGTVLVTAHLGNWDLAGVFLSALNVPISAVVEPIPGGWTRTFARYRNATAMETIPIFNHRSIARALQRRRLLALVADRDLTGRGILLEAFGARRCYPRGPAVYALRFGCPVVVGYFVFQDTPGRPPYSAVVEPLDFEASGDTEADISRLTSTIAKRLNSLIARFPDQWLVFDAGWR